MKTLGFIGMGNMAGAIAAGILQKGLMKKEEVFAYAPHYEKLEANAEKIGFVPCKDLKGLTAKADTLVMACKPYQIEGVLSEIKEELKGKALISIAAGWNYDKYEEISSEDFFNALPEPKQERKRKEIIHLTGDTKSEDRISSETAKMMAALIATMMDNKSK